MKKFLFYLLLTLQLTALTQAMSTSGNESQDNSLDAWLARLAKLPNKQKISVTKKLNKLATVPEIKEKAPLFIQEAERKVTQGNKK